MFKRKSNITLWLGRKSRYLEKKIEKVEKAHIETVDKAAFPQVQNSKNNITPGGNEEFKCNVCDFVGKNKFGLKIHFHKKHSTATFNCFTCDFTCESYSDLCEHNEKYYYSHRQVLNKDYEKHILDEFQRLDEDGFLIHRKLDWWRLFLISCTSVFKEMPLDKTEIVFWTDPCNSVTKIE